MSTPERVTFAGYLCEVVDYCTCAGGGEWPHEPHCGLKPLERIAKPESGSELTEEGGGT